jgi:hypothetical protein
MSIAGFLVSVLYPYLSCLLWHRLVKGQNICKDGYCHVCLLIVTFVTTSAGMALLAVCGMVFFSRPFESRFISYFGSSIVQAMIARTILGLMSYQKAEQDGLVYGREWDNEKQSEAQITARWWNWYPTGNPARR